MNDKELMENMLLLEKGSCDLYLHGTIEAANPNVCQTFSRALNDSLNMQNTIYTKMSQRGWYAPSQAQQNQIDSVRQQFQSQNG